MNVLLLTSLLVITADPVKPKIPLGKDTTYVNGPLDKNGFVDYPEALDAILRKGVTKENNAVVLLWKAIGPSDNPYQSPSDEYFRRLGIDRPAKGNDYVSSISNFVRQTLKIQDSGKVFDTISKLKETSKLPWNPKDHPTLKLWIERNTEALDYAAAASIRSHFYHPQIPTKPKEQLYPYDSTNLTHGLYHLFEPLQARAMMNIALGEYEKAWDDILACHRLVRLISYGPFLNDYFRAVEFHEDVYNTTVKFCQDTTLSPAELSMKLKAIEQLPNFQQFSNIFKIGERFVYLDRFRNPDQMIFEITEERRRKILSIDFTDAMKMGNATYDKIAKIVEMPDRWQRKKAFDKLANEEFPDLSDPREVILDAANKPDARTGLLLGKSLLHTFFVYNTYCEKMERSQQYDRNLRYFQTLLQYHADHKKFPVKLTDLKDVPIDIFTGEPMIYRTIEGGFLLYSIGANGKDDAKFHGDRKSDDIVVRFERKK